ncbi:MAG: GTP diphosphokinase [candidate division WS6 bacterium GW2011_GWF2_39_15]|uniref:GTP diphosphokinase n=1 Tax=candidate division WS6 bacterium GW2011_GWF2_39_15 TaxID=1619100 RepID=A0A0G0MQ76_9BACT|nr:MAG: GTP diphosphokinase [candidate division WS6 bacterium GW2011_GWF2_39_15]
MKRLNDKQTIIKEILKNVPDRFEDIVMKAIHFAELAHNGEKRFSGEDFIIHALNVGLFAAQIRLDTSSVIAGIFHQTTSKRFKTEEQIKKVKGEIKELFGEEILQIVEQLEQLNQATKINKFGNTKVLTKYMLSSSKDIRPLLIKLCDIQEEIKTVEYLPKDKIKGFCKKVLDVYSPLSEFMNFAETKKFLDESAFKILDPENYTVIEGILKEYGINESLKKKYIRYLKTLSEVLDFKTMITGRIKSKYSIYRKLEKYLKEGRNGKIVEISDLLAFSVITKLVSQCFKTSQALKMFTNEREERFDDYISNPKPNGFKAIQMTTQIPEISRLFVEVQILTDEMYYFNTYGPASHIAYKASRVRFARSQNDIDWIEDIHTSITKHINQRETRFSIPVNGEVFKDQVFVFTPKELLIELEKGSSVIDFAYKLHTNIGHSMIAAKINGRLVPITYQPKTGDVIEIISQKGKTNPDSKWLSYAKSTSTKKKIRNRLKMKTPVDRKR